VQTTTDLLAGLDEQGFALTPPLLTPDECEALADGFDDDGRYRSSVDMHRHRFGAGRYRYFAHPLPEPIDRVRRTPLILRYGAGGHNTLHQDIYGDVAFPLQAVTVLDRPGEDFTGGEFVLLEQRPRAQSRAHVVGLEQGAFLVFATRHRPVLGTRGHYRSAMRHGVSTVHSG
jgi:uncharacterized protein